ncbi:TVP38/TMEM64 family protein [Nodosilinea sp. LEGE 07088]|uniref:TVP38/TMEM64 family protein n=1 Tax=Nodosilinea sp. LEGE 07088 TaxID=2777968 RepID=UPI00187EF224|nr:TVP38/TMEM64 family protein [Nodosilinea sp. LEGE 07088]MBE9137629.1 TVP38/TMEM64 family protein [Nodosilinea sp. LEGE 07088]
MARLRWVGLGLGLAIAVSWLWPHRALLLDPQALVAYLNQLGPWRIIGFLAIHVAAAALALPGAVVAIAGGAVFGTLWGTVWSVLGATLGAAVAFCLARLVGQPWCRDYGRNPRPLAWLNQQLQAQAFWCVLTLRLAPISPFSLMNVLLGLTSVRFMPYLGGTLLGIVPGTLAYSWLGAAGLTALSDGVFLPLVGALGLLALLSMLPLVLGRAQST